MDEKGRGKGIEAIRGAVDKSSSQAHAYFLGLFQMWTTNCSLYISTLAYIFYGTLTHNTVSVKNRQESSWRLMMHSCL